MLKDIIRHKLSLRVINIKTQIQGASDDGAGCAVMLEILRIITQNPKLLKYSIIFLFNGAEENILQVCMQWLYKP